LLREFGRGQQLTNWLTWSRLIC